MPMTTLSLLHWLSKTCWRKGGVVLWCMLALLPMASARAALGIEQTQHAPTMLWPLLPGESLQSLAKKLYPQSPILQQRFVQQALTFSRHRGIILQADQQVERAQLVAVPDAAALHTLTHRIKKAEEEVTQIVVQPGLTLSMQITSAGPQSSFSPLIPGVHLPPRLQQWLSQSSLQRLNADWPSSWQEAQGRIIYNSQHWLNGLQLGIQTGQRHLRIYAQRAAENFRHNIRLIAQTPLRAWPAQTQLLMTVISACLLLLCSLIWLVLTFKSNQK